MYAHWLSDAGQEKVDNFRNDGTVREALEKDAGEIGLDTEDLAGIEATVDGALAKYAALPAEAREALAGEKAKLDAVKAKIGNVNAAHTFQDSYGEVLGKSPDDVKTLADATALLPELEEALEGLNALPAPVKGLLAEEIALLENLEKKVGEIVEANAPEGDKTAAEDFRKTHEGILGKNSETVSVDDEDAVDAALSAYAALGDVVKALLLEEYDLLSGLKASIGTLKQPVVITYTAAADGKAGTETSTAIDFTFSGDVAGLTVNDIAVTGGAGSVTKGDLTGSGKDWSLGITVGTEGDVTVSINKTGIASAAQTVAVYKAGGTPQPQSCTITFDSRGGSTVQPVTADADARVPKPGDPVWQGYVFQGWYSEASGGTLYTWPHTLTADVIMYARWTVASYTITYNLDDGTNPGTSPASYTIESSGVTLPTPAKTGYTFGGWFDNSGFTGTAVTVIAAGSTGNKTFYARWSPITYTVTYDANGGSGSMTASTHTYGVSGNLNSNTFINAGCTFTGWNTAKAGGGTNWADGASVSNLSSVGGTTITLYAQWSPWPGVPVRVEVWTSEDGEILVSNAGTTLSKSGADDKAAGLTAEVTGAYSGIQWYLFGVPVSGNRGTAQSITVKAADYPNGSYYLGVTVTKGGVPYSTDIQFTVID
jgi:uncharacterized repeat protein (TIGR02543 family)